MKKRLYKSNDDKQLDGVCAGLGKYFDIDPTIIRLIWAVITLCGGAGIVAYIICAIIIPREPDAPFTEYADYTNIDIDDERGVR